MWIVVAWLLVGAILLLIFAEQLYHWWIEAGVRLYGAVNHAEWWDVGVAAQVAVLAAVALLLNRRADRVRRWAVLRTDVELVPGGQGAMRSALLGKRWAETLTALTMFLLLLQWLLVGTRGEGTAFLLVTMAIGQLVLADAARRMEAMNQLPRRQAGRLVVVCHVAALAPLQGFIGLTLSIVAGIAVLGKLLRAPRNEGSPTTDPAAGRRP
jgi:hypothetical protein